MPNSILTATQIVRESLVQTFNNSAFLGGVTTSLASEFEGYKKGDIVTIQRPVRYLSFDGEAIGSQDAIEPSISLQLNFRKHVPMAFTTKEMTLSLEDFSERHIVPAAQRLANDVDLAIATTAYQEVGNSTGTPGVIPSTLLSLLLGKAKLANFACPVNNPQDLSAIFNPLGEAYITDGLKGVLNTDITTDVVRNGMIGKAGGFMVGMDQNIVRHTVGAWNGTPLVNDAGGTIATAAATLNGATSIPMDGGSGSVSGYLRKGDVVTFQGVNAVNPISKQSSGELMQFVVTADFNTSSGAGTFTIAPAMISTGPQQNVSAAPGDNAPITILGTAGIAYAQNLQFHRNAICVATVPLALPDVPFKARTTMKGVSMRIVRDYAIATDVNTCRLDILFGVKVAFWEHVNRLWGA